VTEICPRRDEILERLISADSTEEPLDDEIRQHLNSCSACSREWERLRAFELFMGGVAEKIASRPTPQVNGPWSSPVRRHTAFPFPTLITGFLAVVAALVLIWVSSRPGSEPVWHKETGAPVTPPSAPAVNPKATGFQIVEGEITSVDVPGKPLPDTGLPSNVALVCAEGTTIIFPSGVEARLARSTFRLSESALSLMVGFVRVKVPHHRPTRFSVSTPCAVLGVRGTRFSVRVKESGATEVEVQEGSVSISTIAREEQLLSPGDRLSIDPLGKLGPVLVAPGKGPAASSLFPDASWSQGDGVGAVPATPAKGLIEPVKNVEDALGD